MAPYPIFQFDREKFKDVVHYVCATCRPEELGAVKLHKVLYFSDMLHFAFTGQPITGSAYRKRPFGPTSDFLLPALNELRRDGAIKVARVNYFGYMKQQFIAQREPDRSKLNSNELDLINEVIQFVCKNNTAKTISEFSHNEAWERAEFGDELPYHTAFYLFPTEVSSEAKAWAGAEVEKIEAERSSGSPVGCRDFRDFRSRLHEARGAAS